MLFHPRHIAMHLLLQEFSAVCSDVAGRVEQAFLCLDKRLGLPTITAILYLLIKVTHEHARRDSKHRRFLQIRWHLRHRLRASAALWSSPQFAALILQFVSRTICAAAHIWQELFVLPVCTIQPAIARITEDIAGALTQGCGPSALPPTSSSATTGAVERPLGSMRSSSAAST